MSVRQGNAYKFLTAVLSTAAAAACTAKKEFGAPAFVFRGLDNANISSDGSITLTWEKVPTADVAFYIYRRAKKDTAFNFSSPWKTTQIQSYDIPAYSLNESYCYVVRYIKEDLLPDTNEKEVCPDLVSIDDFTGISSVVSTATGTAEVSWKQPDSASNIAGYRVYTGTDFSTKIASGLPSQSSIVIPGLSPDETYSFGVRAFDSYGREDNNARTLTVQIVNNSAPAFAGLKSIVASGTGCATLSWLPADGRPKEYRIYQKSGAFNSAPTIASFLTPVATVSANTLNTTFSKQICNLGDEQDHSFVVRAASSGGQEDPNMTTAKTISMPDAGAPVFSGISNVNFSNAKAVVTWNAAVGETTSYKVYYQAVASASFNFATANVVTVASTETSKEILGLPDNTTYTFAVRAVDSHNQFDTNTELRQKNSGDLTPPAFLGISNTSAPLESRIVVTFNRSTESDVAQYSVRYRLQGSTTWQEGASVNQVSSGATLQGTINGLSGGSVYEIIVKAFDTSGNESTNTQITTKSTPDQTPPSFGGVSSAVALSGDPTTAVVSWTAATDPSGIQEYRIYYSTSSLAGVNLNKGMFASGNTQVISGKSVIMSNAINGSDVSRNVASLSSMTTYYFVVHAIDNQSNEDINSALTSYSVPNTTPPVSLSSLGTLAFSPNPSGPTPVRTFAVTGTATTGNTVKIYRDGILAATQDINTGTSFSVTVTLPNTSGNYVITAKQVNSFEVESSSSTVGTYLLDVSGPAATIQSAMNPTKVGGAGATISSASFVFSANEAGTYVLKEGTTTVTSGTMNANTNTTVVVNSSSLGASDGPHALSLIASDAAGNTSTTSLSLTLDTQPPLNVTNLVAVKNEQSGLYEFSWTNNSLEATDQIFIRRAVSTLTPPTATSGTVVVGNISSTTTTASIAYSTETTAAFTVQACDAVGNCADVTACSSCKASLNANWSYNVQSEGSTLGANSWDIPGSVTFRVAQSSNLSIVQNWNGVDTSLASGAVKISGDSGCTTTLCSWSFTNDATEPAWARKYYRIAGTNSSAGGVGVRLSKIRYWAKVPTGMVFIAKEEWPNAPYELDASVTESYSNPYDFAVDKYQVSIKGKAAGGGYISLAARTDYPNNLSTVFVSVPDRVPDIGSFYSVKQACLNRSYDPDYSGYATTADLSSANSMLQRTVNSNRKFKLFSGKEFFIAAYGTPRSSATDYCLLDSRVTSYQTADATGSASSSKCISYHGVRNMLGSATVLTDERFMGGVRGAIVGSYGTTEESSLARTTDFIVTAADSVNWNFDIGFPVRSTSASSFPKVTGLAQYSATMEGGYINFSENDGWVAFRGNHFASTLAAASRHYFQTYGSPYYTNFFARCSIQAPRAQATINSFEMKSTSTEARMFWNISNTENNSVVRIGWSSALSDLTAWTGTSTNPNNGGIVTDFSTCSSYTPTAGTIFTGKFCESPGSLRYYKLCVENKNASGASLGAPVCSNVRAALINGAEPPALASMLATGRTNLQSDSIGKYAVFLVKAGVGDSPKYRVAYSSYKNEIDSWQGESKTFLAGGYVDSTLTDTCTPLGITTLLTANTDYTFRYCFDMSIYPKWTKLFFKVAIVNHTASYETPAAVSVSDTQAHAYVPDGMVFVARELWPSSDYPSVPYCVGGYNTSSSARSTLDTTTAGSMNTAVSHNLHNCRYDFAIDKFETNLASGTLNHSSFLASPAAGATTSANNTTNGALKSGRSTNVSTTLNASWYSLKKGCWNRNGDATVTGFPGTTEATRVRMATGVEWVVAATGLNEPQTNSNDTCFVSTTNGAGFANAGVYPKCTSNFGTFDQAGNLWEATDEVSFDFSSGVGNVERFYGTTAVVNPFASITVPTSTGPTGVFNFLTSLATTQTGATLNSYYVAPNVANGAAGWAMFRGGEKQNHTSSGRKVHSFSLSPAAVSIPGVGTRCSISAP